MLSVSPPHASGWLSTFGEARAAKRLRRQSDILLAHPVEHNDIDIDEGLSTPEVESLASTSSLASSSASSSRASPAIERIRARSTSSSVASSSTAPCLLIRSMHQGWERTFELHADWPLPRVEKSDEVLIEHRAVGLNPVDYKSVLYNFGVPDSPWVLGRDIAGVVAAIGDDVTDVQVGQRVWTCADARDIRAGAYQSYSVCRRAHLSVLDTDKISDEEAATLGTGLVTASIAAYCFFNWPRARFDAKKSSIPVRRMSSKSTPRIRDKSWLLIYGGGAITGIYMAQLARLSGLKTVAVASPSNFDYLQSAAIGVDACVDRRLSPEEIARQVQELTLADDGSGVQYILDCVGSKTATLCRDIAVETRKTLRRSPGRVDARLPSIEMIGLAGNPKPAATEQKDGVSAGSVSPDAVVHRISFSTTIYGDDVFATSLMSNLGSLLASGQLVPARPEILPDGLAGVRRGLEMLRDNAAPRARKLVVNISNTPHAHLTNLGVRAETCWNGVA